MECWNRRGKAWNGPTMADHGCGRALTADINTGMFGGIQAVILRFSVYISAYFTILQAWKTRLSSMQLNSRV